MASWHRPVIHHRSGEAVAVGRARSSSRAPKYAFRTAERRPDPGRVRAPGRWRRRSSTPCRPARKAIVLDAGWFASRWGVIARTYGIEVVTLPTPWGRPVDPDAVAAALADHPDAHAVCGTLSETSTGDRPPD